MIPGPGGRPSTSPLQPFGGVARRGRPTLELGAGGEPPRPGTLGPHGARVRVVPLEGLSRNTVRALVPDTSATRGALFEVQTEWWGPGLPELPPVDRPVQGSDSVVVGDQELAEAIARAAADLLGAGRLPWLRHLRRAVEHDRAAWRRRYDADVGDGDRPA